MISLKPELIYIEQFFKHRHRKPPIQDDYFNQVRLELCSFEMCHFPAKDLLGTMPKSDFYHLKQNLKFIKDEFFFLPHIHIIIWKKNKDITSSLQCLDWLTYYLILIENRKCSSNWEIFFPQDLVIKSSKPKGKIIIRWQIVFFFQGKRYLWLFLF